MQSNSQTPIGSLTKNVYWYQYITELVVNTSSTEGWYPNVPKCEFHSCHVAGPIETNVTFTKMFQTQSLGR